jgi:hypothetical protein
MDGTGAAALAMVGAVGMVAVVGLAATCAGLLTSCAFAGHPPRRRGSERLV